MNNVKYSNRFKVSVIINGERCWWQEGCMGRYWGTGNHKETIPWIKRTRTRGQRRRMQTGGTDGTLINLYVISLGDNLTLHLHDAQTEEEFGVIKPNRWTNFKLLCHGINRKQLGLT